MMSSGLGSAVWGVSASGSGSESASSLAIWPSSSTETIGFSMFFLRLISTTFFFLTFLPLSSELSVSVSEELELELDEELELDSELELELPVVELVLLVVLEDPLRLLFFPPTSGNSTRPSVAGSTFSSPRFSWFSVFINVSYSPANLSGNSLTELTGVTSGLTFSSGSIPSKLSPFSILDFIVFSWF